MTPTPPQQPTPTHRCDSCDTWYFAPDVPKLCDNCEAQRPAGVKEVPRG